MSSKWSVLLYLLVKENFLCYIIKKILKYNVQHLVKDKVYKKKDKKRETGQMSKNQKNKQATDTCSQVTEILVNIRKNNHLKTAKHI